METYQYDTGAQGHFASDGTYGRLHNLFTYASVFRAGTTSIFSKFCFGMCGECRRETTPPAFFKKKIVCLFPFTPVAHLSLSSISLLSSFLIIQCVDLAVLDCTSTAILEFPSVPF